ncbi:hypothetical protein CKM354_000805800 [Cercospora kikuchii]|uniref:SET domain-containing protein n=1 Tax=Cercospora kikuchii TaxID=84275 RepID=A0A9P3CNY2_9PEZI|nr:uncharacterized protein CKM354_000805800 [Cercospora kikuchii]GIZ44872.1 hypothetical protein CKM354_000805800 [Cercospora kikuchii]
MAELEQQKHSVVEHFRAACAAQKQQADQLKGKPRDQLPFLSRDAIRQTLKAGHEQQSQTADSAENSLHVLIVAHPYPACSKSVRELDCTLSIKDMLLETRHDGRALILRRFDSVVTNAVGGTYGVEDAAGTTELLLIDAFNFAGDDVLPAGAVFAIKEPYCKVDAGGNARIKVSHPTDLVHLNPGDQLSPLHWRVDGLAVSGTMASTVTQTDTKVTGSAKDYTDETDQTEVRSTPQAGRGLFATNSFKLGDQILAERAAFLVSVKDDNTYHALKYDLSRNMMTDDRIGAPYKELARKLLHDPTLAFKVFDLHSGVITAPCDAENRVDGKPVLDIFHIHEVWATNAIACPVSVEDKAFPGRLSADSVLASGLWCRTAYCNHSCMPNAEKSIKDGVLTLRATRTIKEDEEITISYGEFSNQAEKQRALYRIWGFKCDCKLCKAEARDTDDILNRREALRARISAPLPAKLDATVVSDSRAMVTDAQATYAEFDDDTLPRLVIAEAYSRLYAVYSKLLNLDAAEKALLSMLKALAVLDFTSAGEVVPLGGNLEEITVTNVLLLADLQKKADQNVVALRLEKFAQKVYLTLNGDMSGFEKLVLPVIPSYVENGGED